MKKFKRFICILLLVVIIAGVGAGVTVYFLCNTYVDSSKYTEAQHLKRISGRIQEIYIDDKNFGFTGFKAYPMYNENEEMEHCLIEFEPSGFFCIKINKTSQMLPLPWKMGMYSTDVHAANRGSRYFHLDLDWQRFRIVDSLDGLALYPEGQWKLNEKWRSGDSRQICEVDQNGEYIYYRSSPFKVASALGERMYCIEREDKCCFALKQDDKYFNLVSMEMLTEKDRSYATFIRSKESNNLQIWG